MDRLGLVARVLASVAAVTTVAGAVSAQQARPAGPTWMNAKLTAQQRADALLRAMTLEEKAGQVSQQFVFGDAAPFEPVVRDGKVGSLLFVTDPATINRLQRVAVTQARLKVPLIFGYDVIHGFRTIFPVPIANAASWDPAGVERVQAVAAVEARSVGIH